MTGKLSHIRAVKRYVGPAAALLVVALGVIVVAVATPALAQTPDPRDPLALYDTNENGQIDGEEFVTAFRDYTERRIDATLLMRVRQLYLSTIATGSSQPGFFYPACVKYDTMPANEKIELAEAIRAVQEYFDEEVDLPLEVVITVLECYYSTSAHYVRFATSTYPVEEGSVVDVTLEMSLPYGTSTVDVPIVVAGGSAGSRDFSFTRVGSNTSSTTVTFAASSTTTSFTVYARRDGDRVDETVILRLGTFSTSTMPMGVHPSTQMGTTTVTILGDIEVNISANKDGIDEGDSIEFTVTADRPPSSALPVTVSVRQKGDFIRGTPQQTVTINSGTTTASFLVLTNNDATDEVNGSITATIETGTGYKVGRNGSKSVVVRDDDEPVTQPPPTPLPPPTATPVPPASPTITISGFADPLGVGSSKQFEVTASNLLSTASYSIRVETDDGNIGFNDTCTSDEHTATVQTGSTTHTEELTLYACRSDGGKVTAKL